MNQRRFWARVDSDGVTGCWLWRGATALHYNGRMMTPRRVAWILSGHPDDLSQEVRTSCGTAACCNPSHLFATGRKNTASDFWRFVSREPGHGPNGDCWIWTGNTSHRFGYGQFRFQMKQYNAHRFSLEHFGGGIPEGMVACHRCDNPPCVRPDHLFAGTQADNIQDASRKGRTISGEAWYRACGESVRRGESHHKAKITESVVREIRRAAIAGERHREIAARVGLSQPVVSKIAVGELWGHVDGPVARKSKPRNLTVDDVGIIRQRCSDGEAKANIAADYGVSPATIYSIEKRQSWRNVA